MVFYSAVTTLSCPRHSMILRVMVQGISDKPSTTLFHAQKCTAVLLPIDLLNLHSHFCLTGHLNLTISHILHLCIVILHSTTCFLGVISLIGGHHISNKKVERSERFKNCFYPAQSQDTSIIICNTGHILQITNVKDFKLSFRTD